MSQQSLLTSVCHTELHKNRYRISDAVIFGLPAGYDGT